MRRSWLGHAYKALACGGGVAVALHVELTSKRRGSARINTLALCPARAATSVAGIPFEGDVSTKCWEGKPTSRHLDIRPAHQRRCLLRDQRSGRIAWLVACAGSCR
jgi:hypothetical protein